MQLIKKQFIDSSKLSGRDYLVTLIREAQATRLIPPETPARIQKESMDIVASLASELTDGASSSIRIEQAQELLLSAFYTAGLALKACDTADEAALRLATEPFRSIYSDGEKIIKKKLASAHMLHRQVSKNLFLTKNVFYASTLIDGIKGFFKLYNPKFGAHETHITADYPTFIPVNDLTGIEFIEKYLEYLDLENRFLLCFDPKAVDAMLFRFDEGYDELVLNLFEHVLTEALCCSITGNITGSPAGSLDCSKTIIREQLAGKSPIEVEALFCRAFDSLSYELSRFTDCKLSKGVVSYVRRSIPAISKEFAIISSHTKK